VKKDPKSFLNSAMVTEERKKKGGGGVLSGGGGGHSTVYAIGYRGMPIGM
jgi:dihydroxyacetone kinase